MTGQASRSLLFVFAPLLVAAGALASVAGFGPAQGSATGGGGSSWTGGNGTTGQVLTSNGDPAEPSFQDVTSTAVTLLTVKPIGNMLPSAESTTQMWTSGYYDGQAILVDASSSLSWTSDGLGFIQNTSTVSGNISSWTFSSAPSILTSGLPHFSYRFSISRTTNVRFWHFVSNVGASIFGANDDVNGKYVGLTFSTNRGDTNFQWVEDDQATGQLLTDTGVAPVADTIYVVDQQWTSTTSVTMTLSDDSGTVLDTATLTSRLPDAFLGMDQSGCVTTLTTSAVSLRTYHAQVAFGTAE